jgi:hypothetical protein
LKENCRVIVSPLAGTHEEGELLNFMLFRPPLAGDCLGSLSGESPNPVSENSEGRLTDWLFRGATIVPLNPYAQ